jgi:hypothetical protein
MVTLNFSHRGGPDSKPGLAMWDLWFKKWRWGRFSPSTSVSIANLYSTNISTIKITYHPGLVQKASTGRSTGSPTAEIKKTPQFPSELLMLWEARSSLSLNVLHSGYCKNR